MSQESFAQAFPERHTQREVEHHHNQFAVNRSSLCEESKSILRVKARAARERAVASAEAKLPARRCSVKHCNAAA